MIMSLWTFLTVIIVVSILAGTFSEYHKRTKSFRHETGNDLEDIREDISRLRKRLENLEAIAAGDPDEFSVKQKTGHNSQQDKKPAEEIKEFLEKRRS